MRLNRVVLDILKPHQPGIIQFAKELGNIDKSYSVNVKVMEIDEQTESVEVILEGKDINFDKVQEIINALGGSIHSIDEASCGETIIRAERDHE